MLLLLLPAAARPAAGGTVPACHEGPLLTVPLRVHAGGSGRSRGEMGQVLAEINRIWRFQAGICFAGEIVDHDEPLPAGLDIWFVPSLERYNGYFSGLHDITVRDVPDLRPVQDPSSDGAARTAAHEIGHGLGLVHRQESEENLMCSKTLGWKLSDGEVAEARHAASRLASREGGHPACICPPAR